MFKFFRKKKSATPAPRPLAPYRFGYSLDHFRSHPDWVDGLRRMIATPDFQAMLSVLQHEIPLDSIDAVRGHRRALRLIELMATHPERPKDEIEPTFGADKEFPELTADEPQTT